MIECREDEPEEAPGEQRHGERLHQPIDHQRHQPARPAFVPTLRMDAKSTFIIIGVIISQIRTAIGTLIWLPLAELHAA